MPKIELTDKISLLDGYIAKPRGMNDTPILKAIKADVVKANTKGVSKASEADNWLYNECIGSYRHFLRQRDTHLDMSGKKAAINSRAMRNIINYIRSFQKANHMPHNDADVLAGVQFIFTYWHRLSDFHQKRILLPDIYDRIEEIISQIKNGHDKRTTANSKIEQRQLELEQQRRSRADTGH